MSVQSTERKQRTNWGGPHWTRAEEDRAVMHKAAGLIGPQIADALVHDGYERRTNKSISEKLRKLRSFDEVSGKKGCSLETASDRFLALLQEHHDPTRLIYQDDTAGYRGPFAFWTAPLIEPSRERLTFIIVNATPKSEPIPVKVFKRPQLHVDDVQPVPTKPSIEHIKRVTAAHYGLTADDLSGKRRHLPYIRPRQIAMYLAKELTLHSLPKIGNRFGDRDHTTVMHAIRKINQYLECDAGLRDEIENLKALIES